MTNNPTIDGVSRELLERIISYQWFPSGEVAVFDLRRIDRESLRALLDSPAVERKEPYAFRFKWDYDHGNGWCRGTIRFVETMEEVDHEDKSTWRDITPLYEVAPEVAALQSTIAQLQAEQQLLQSTVAQYLDRITELESGRGEPVAVVLPERQERTTIPYDSVNDYADGWNACLDATAALNTPNPAEWHDVAGDDEGLVS